MAKIITITQPETDETPGTAKLDGTFDDHVEIRFHLGQQLGIEADAIRIISAGDDGTITFTT